MKIFDGIKKDKEMPGDIPAKKGMIGYILERYSVTIFTALLAVCFLFAGMTRFISRKTEHVYVVLLNNSKWYYQEVDSDVFDTFLKENGVDMTDIILHVNDELFMGYHNRTDQDDSVRQTVTSLFS